MPSHSVPNSGETDGSRRRSTPRIVLVGASWLALLTCAVGEAATARASRRESEEMAKMRQKAKRRRRRIIYNNDSCDVMVAGANTPDGFLSKRMKPTLNTQVDSVFYCTGATTMFTHRPKVGEAYGKYVTDKSQGMARFARDNLKALAEAGTDPLELAIKFCKETDLEVFFTHRINDIHDSFLDWELTTWKREHPEYLMGKPEDRQKYPNTDPRCRWSALDFEIQAVRHYLIAIIDDVLTRYDVDGIEIDYFRSPMFFRPNLTFQAATAAQVEILTGFQRRVRERAYEHGNRRGRSILVAARVPMTRKTCLHVGIDIERWLKDDLLDVLTTGGGYVPFTMPTRELVELGHAHEVPVYPTISASGMKGHNTFEAWRAAAANAWHAGADGMYLFNTFPRKPKHPHFAELGDPEALARMDKVFMIDDRPMLSGGLVQGVTQSQILPVELDWGGKAREVTLPVGEDIAAAGKAERLALAQLRIRLERKRVEDMVDVRLNGNPIEATEEDTKSGWVTYATDPSQYRHGDNTLSFRVAGRGAPEAKPIVVKSVELRVDYK